MAAGSGFRGFTPYVLFVGTCAVVLSSAFGVVPAKTVVLASSRTMDNGINRAPRTHYIRPVLRQTSSTSSVPVPGYSQQPQLVRADDQVAQPGYTVFSHTTQNADGSFSIQVFPTPQFRPTPTGWQPIDLTLTPLPGGGFVAPGALAPLTFGTTATNAVTLTLPNGAVTLQPQGMNLSSPTAAGQTVTYSNVATDTDLRYTVTDSGFKEELVLRSASAPTSFSFHILDPSHALGTQTSMSNEAVRFTGSVIAGSPIEIPPPLAYQPDTTSGPSQRVFGSAHLQLSTALDGYDATLSVDPSWLTGKSFPIILDPSLTYAPNDDVFAPSTPGYAPTASTLLDAGVDCCTIWRSFMKFPLPIGTSSLPYNSQVTAANVYMYRYQCASGPCPPNTAFELRGMTGSWSDTTDSGTLDNLIDGQVLSSGYGTDSSSAEWQHLDVTSLVQQWVDQQFDNNGIVWKASTETAGVGQNYYYSTRATSSNKPYITLTFYTPLLGQQNYLKYFQARLTDRSTLEVNLSTGGLLIHNKDLQIAGTAGWNVQLDRYYNSLDTSMHAFGNYWQASFGPDVKLSWSGTDTSTVTYSDKSGTAFVFTNPTSSGVYQNSSPIGSFAGPPGPEGGLNADLTKNPDGTLDLVYHQSQEDLRFNTSGRLYTDKDRNLNTITYCYTSRCLQNDTGNLVSVKDTKGSTLTVTPWTSNTQLIQQIQDSTGRNVQYSYDGSNNLTQFTDGGGHNWTYTYNGSALTDIKSNATGRETEITYTSDLKHVQSVQFVTNSPNPGDGPTWTFDYDPGHTEVTDPRGHIWDYTFDDLDRITNISDPLTHSEDFSWDSNSDLTEVRDAYEKPMDNTYASDGTFNLTKTTMPTGEFASLSYLTSGGTAKGWQYLPISGTDMNGAARSYTYDAVGNLNSSTDSLSSQNQVTLTYNSDGTVAGVKDANGNVTSACTSGSFTTCFSYSSGNLQSVTNPTNLANESITVDQLNRLKTHYFGNTIHALRYCYDSLDRITKIVSYSDPNNCSSSTPYVKRVYDADGNLTQQVDASGTTNYSYDPLNRLTVKQPPSSSSDCSGAVTGQTTCYSWDGDNNLSTYQDSGGVTNYAYDSANRLSSLTDPSNNTTQFQYNNDNSRTETLYPNGVTLNYGFDDSQRVSSVTIKNANQAVLQSYTYCYRQPATGCDANPPPGWKPINQRTRVIDATGNQTVYLYDGLNRLCDARTTNSGGTQTSHFVYTYDGNSNMLTKTTGSTTVYTTSCPGSAPADGSTTSYSYDAANQLAGSHSQGSVYDGGSPGAGDETFDGLGNVASTYNDLDQTTSQTPSGQSTISYTYSGAFQDDRLSETQGSTTVTFTNSSLGTTAEQVVGGSNPGTTYFVRDNEGTLVEERPPTGVNYYYLFDALGTVTGLDHDGSQTSPENRYTYKPFGAVSTATEAVFNPFRFAGYYYDASTGGPINSTGLYHIGQRYMDPSPGAAAWLQRDPITNPADPGSWNRYVYVGDDPVNYTDPTGKGSFGSFFTGIGVTFGLLGYGIDVVAAIGVVTGAFVIAPELVVAGALVGTIGAAYGVFGWLCGC